MPPIRVLFLCTGNSARSQMAEAFLRRDGGARFEAHSAGLKPQPIHPLTIQVMSEIGLSLQGQYAKPLSDYLGKVHFGYLITVCADADKNCPSVFPGMGQRRHWALDDPAAFEGSDEAKLEKFRQVRDQIAQRVQDFIAQVPS